MSVTMWGYEDTSGHRLIASEGDVTVEAWGPGRADCVAHAVRALVESFADLRGAVPRATITRPFEPRSDDDLLIDVLEETLLQVEEHDRVPVDVEVADNDDGTVTVHFAVVPGVQVTCVGPLPNTIAPDGVELRQVCGGWRCHAVAEL